MSAERVLDFEQLQRITGYTRRADVERALRSQGIRLFLGRKGPWTTIDLVNEAGGMQSAGKQEYSPDII
jgi:hypothetical protein